MTQVSASVLAADLANIQTELISVEPVDRLHLDIMDGHFVPNISFGSPLIERIQQLTEKPLDVHLMATQPNKHVRRLLDLDVDSITVHVEAVDDLQALMQTIQKYGIDVGVALNPGTSLGTVESVITAADRVVVMGVEPGFTGQKFTPKVLKKVEKLDTDYNTTIEIDGGITVEYAYQSIEAGADIIVSGSTIFDSSNRKDRIAELRSVDQ